MNQRAVHGLAVIGFIALVGAGMWLAIFSTRYVPTVVNGAGAAAVYLGSLFSPAPNRTLAPAQAAATTTLPGDAASTPVASASPARRFHAPAPGSETAGAYAIASAAPPSLHGLPHFAVGIDAIGYLATTSADSFVASSTVPVASRPAVRFTVQNTGTNVTGSWRFSASIPTASGFVYQSDPQQSLNPGDRINYTLGFDQAILGASKTITITVNFDHVVVESDATGDTASTTLTILGS